MSNQSNLSKVVIFGAGPAGLLLAHYLLERGKYQVEMYERRSHPDKVAKENRTFPISLQKRGQKALQRIPSLADAIAQASVYCQGTWIHKKNGQTRKIARKTPTQTIDRLLLVKTLLQHLTDNYTDDRLKIHFDCQCIDIDDNNQQLTFQTSSKTGENLELKVSYDFLVGADGSRSYVREFLIKNTGLNCEEKYVPDDYKSLYFHRTNDRNNLALAADKIHVSGMGNQLRVILVPQPDNKLNGVIIFNSSDNPLTKLKTKTEITQFFQTNFPTFAQLMPETEAEALLTRPVAKVMTVNCDRAHHGNNILLIGDALHAVSPSMGQGCNSALEDVLIFCQLLERNQDNWETTLQEFSQQRIPEVQALQTLSNYSFPRTKLLAGEFFLRLTLSRVLNRFFHQLFQPFLFDLVMDTDTPYSQILQMSQGWIRKVKKSMDKTQKIA